MRESIVLTVVVTAGNNIDKILQKKGTVILPPLSFKLKVLRAYALNKTWVIGFLMDIFGALLMLRALALARVSVIQPVSGCGLAILSISSQFYLKEVMNAVDLVGITLAGLGTTGVGAGGEQQEDAALSIFRIPSLTFVIFILFTRGLKHGREVVVSTCAAVASILTGELAGMVALGERLPSAPKARLLLLLRCLLIIAAVILLLGSTRLVRLLNILSRSF